MVSILQMGFRGSERVRGLPKAHSWSRASVAGMKHEASLERSTRTGPPRLAALERGFMLSPSVLETGGAGRERRLPEGEM